MEKKSRQITFFFFFPRSPPNNYWDFFGKEQIRNAAVFVIIRLERLPSCNSIRAAGIVGNAMQIAPKVLEKQGHQCEKDTVKYSPQCNFCTLLFGTLLQVKLPRLL